MKILAVSDEESPALWDYYRPGILDEYALILGCGDLKASYLEFLVTMSHARLLYIHGNHDESYEEKPPEGCDCIDDHVVVFNGVRILGLGGSLRYRPGPYQYSDAQMQRRILRLRSALRRSGGVDIVVTHAPPLGLGDRPDPAHRGFAALLGLLDRYHPQYLLHGHIHPRYIPKMSPETSRGDCRIINVSPRFDLVLPDRITPEEDRERLIWVTRHREPAIGWDDML